MKIYVNLEPNWPLFLKVGAPPKQGLNSNQNKGPPFGFQVKIHGSYGFAKKNSKYLRVQPQIW